MAFVGNFQLSVTRALRDQLLTALEALDIAPLDEVNLSNVEERAGVYQLFVDGELVYVGKAARNLRSRLSQHRKKLSGRTHGVLARTEFKCVYVSEDLDAIAPEAMLISHYRNTGGAPWNFNGFGNNDPGRQRDTSLVASNHFDSLYPIDLDVAVPFATTSPERLGPAMQRLKSVLPFVFRFAPVPAALTIEPPSGAEATVRDWIGQIASTLPADWSVVALPGYVIAYPDRPAETFESRVGTWQRKPDGSTEWVAHEPVFGVSAPEATSDAPEN